MVLDQKMKSTVFSAVAVSIGYVLLGWDFTTVLGNPLLVVWHRFVTRY